MQHEGSIIPACHIYRYNNTLTINLFWIIKKDKQIQLKERKGKHYLLSNKQPYIIKKGSLTTSTILLTLNLNLYEKNVGAKIRLSRY